MHNTNTRHDVAQLTPKLGFIYIVKYNVRVTNKTSTFSTHGYWPLLIKVATTKMLKINVLTQYTAHFGDNTNKYKSWLKS